MAAIDIRSSVTDRAAVVAVAGDLDVDTAPQLRLALSRCFEQPLDSLSVQLGEVSFCDCAGLNVLLWMRKWAIDAGVRFRLLAPRPQLINLLKATGTVELFREAFSPASGAA
ncbi:STAS domain-containing protein [Streptomyces sp. KR80]|uniref:STAS domain-containing protein n=1 Tax=Streptomyces sp. KR80 TaxID=3457426 RepID=UPI003FD498B5